MSLYLYHKNYQTTDYIFTFLFQNGFYEVIVQCPKDDTSELEEALKTTNVIDWKRCNEVPYAPQHVVDVVKRLYHEKNLVIDYISTTVTFILDKEAPLYDVR